MPLEPWVFPKVDGRNIYKQMRITTNNIVYEWWGLKDQGLCSL